MGNDIKRSGAYIALKPGVRPLMDGICGLKGVTRTDYINNLVEADIVNTYNAMPNRDAVLEAQQAIAQTNPPLATLYQKLNERVSGVAAPDEKVNSEESDQIDNEEEEEVY